MLTLPFLFAELVLPAADLLADTAAELVSVTELLIVVSEVTGAFSVEGLFV